jgi:hypothetical protein
MMPTSMKMIQIMPMFHGLSEEPSSRTSGIGCPAETLFQQERHFQPNSSF